jgi:hypothetical protein
MTTMMNKIVKAKEKMDRIQKVKMNTGQREQTIQRIVKKITERNNNNNLPFSYYSNFHLGSDR